jgi:hypothetical protein
VPWRLVRFLALTNPRLSKRPSTQVMSHWPLPEPGLCCHRCPAQGVFTGSKRIVPRVAAAPSVGNFLEEY